MKKHLLWVLIIFVLVGCASETNEETTEKQSKEDEVEQVLITPTDVLDMYYGAIETENMQYTTPQFDEKLKPWLDINEESHGENGPPNMLLPEVRMEVLEESKEKVQIRTIEFANESYKTGQFLTLTVTFDAKTKQWLLDDLVVEGVETDNKPFNLTWEEMEKYFELQKLEVDKKEETEEYATVLITKGNEMLFEGYQIQMSKRNGLITILSSGEEEEAAVEETSVEEETVVEAVQSTFENFTEYEGKWQDDAGSIFLTVEGASGSKATLTFDICYSGCSKIGSTEPTEVEFVDGNGVLTFADDGFGNSGEVSLKITPNGIESTFNGNIAMLKKIR